MIKSALELALERTANIQGDKSSAEKKQQKTKGRRLAAAFLASEKSLDELRSSLKGSTEAFREGLVATFLDNLILPTSEADAENPGKIQTGLAAICREEKSLSMIFSQIQSFFSQYLNTRSQLEESLRQQFLPSLKKREQELAAQMGQQVKLEAESLPEFHKALSENYAALKERFGGAMDEVKTEIRKLC